MNDEDIYSKTSAVRTLVQILMDDEKAKWYILGLIDGIELRRK